MPGADLRTVAASSAIDTGDVFILKNEDPETIRKPLHGKMYVIEPGQRAIVPFDLIRVWWGDPRSRENVFVPFSDSKERGFVNKRELELRRLGVLYGSYGATAAELMAPNWPPGSAHLGSPKVCPQKISVVTESGQQIVPPCFDDTNALVYAAVRMDSEDLTDEATYRDHLMRELDASRAQQATLEERLERLEARELSDVTVDGEDEKQDAATGAGAKA